MAAVCAMYCWEASVISEEFINYSLRLHHNNADKKTSLLPLLYIEVKLDVMWVDQLIHQHN